MSEDRGVIRWTGPPDPEKGIYYPLVSPKPGQEVVAVILSETICGVVTYFVPATRPGERGHSLPCTCGEKPCEGRLAKRDHRWKGYLACWDRGRGRLFLAEVTKEAYLRCPGFELFKGALRGKVLRLTRNGEAANARVTASLAQYAGPLVDLPAAFNVQSALERLWFGTPGPALNQRPGGREAPRAAQTGERKDGPDA